MYIWTDICIYIISITDTFFLQIKKRLFNVIHANSWVCMQYVPNINHDLVLDNYGPLCLILHVVCQKIFSRIFHYFQYCMDMLLINRLRVGAFHNQLVIHLWQTLSNFSMNWWNQNKRLDINKIHVGEIL